MKTVSNTKLIDSLNCLLIKAEDVMTGSGFSQEKNNSKLTLENINIKDNTVIITNNNKSLSIKKDPNYKRIYFNINPTNNEIEITIIGGIYRVIKIGRGDKHHEKMFSQLNKLMSIDIEEQNVKCLEIVESFL